MNFKNIEDYSLLYEVGRFFTSFTQNNLFYKQVHVTGLENIPENEAVILAANHQNTIMDAQAIISAKRWQPIYLTRADVFNNPFIAKLLITMKLLPVYRIRDGKESLKNNEEIFNKNVEILKKKKYLGIFPEASHEGKRRLRTIHKGISRIAFQAEEESDFKLNLKIVPIGINYSDYYKFRSVLLVNFGKPIQINDLQNEYKENPNAAHNEVRRRIAEGIKPLIINIENEKFYDMYENLREIYDKTLLEKVGVKKQNFPQKFIADKKLIAALDLHDEENLLEMEELNKKVENYVTELKKHKIKDSIFENKKSWISLVFKLLFSFISFPIFVFGAITNIIPFLTPNLITKKMKDRNFHTSVQWAVWFFIFPIYYLIISVLAIILLKLFWIKLIFIFSLPFAGHFAYWLWKLLKKNLMTIRYYFKFNNLNIKDLRAKRTEIIKIVDQIIINFEVKNIQNIKI